MYRMIQNYVINNDFKCTLCGSVHAYGRYVELAFIFVECVSYFITALKDPALKWFAYCKI
jgi:hypothetical protein